MLNLFEIISYKTSLLGAKIEFKINIFKFYIQEVMHLALYQLAKENSELDKG